ncbi:MAG: hypothetical protein IJT79_10060 [Ruminococcus sp.]|nr:hypothetical protein [Ruminococcus sp.]
MSKLNDFDIPKYLLYAKKKGKPEEKAVKAQKNFLKKISVNNAKKQSYILLGLALHTIQDYFAHVIRAKIKHTYYCNNPYLPSNECIKETPYKEYFMYQIDDIMGYLTAQLKIT